MSDKLLDGYPQAVGAKYEAVVQHTGPASYAQMTPGAQGSPATGGDKLTAQACGFGYIEDVQPAVSLDGLYEVFPIMVSNGPQQSVILAWYTLNSTQVAGATNLSTTSVRLRVRGI